jgi:hypothetical protein
MEDFLPDRLLTNPLNEVFDDLEVDVGLNAKRTSFNASAMFSSVRTPAPRNFFRIFSNFSLS